MDDQQNEKSDAHSQLASRQKVFAFIGLALAALTVIAWLAYGAASGLIAVAAVGVRTSLPSI